LIEKQNLLALLFVIVNMFEDTTTPRFRVMVGVSLLTVVQKSGNTL
jgi:hypothetical protein